MKFPSTPHLVWLHEKTLRGDKVLAYADVTDFLCHEIVVEEKVDGANLGISFDSNQNVFFQNRGNYISSYSGQFIKTRVWFSSRADLFWKVIRDRYICFGEWCYAKHSIHYTKLPDWFLCFDFFDRYNGFFIDSKTRNQIALKLGIPTVPHMATGFFSISDLSQMIKKSALYEGNMEGIYLRHETNGCLISRAKIVNREFIQNITRHWTKENIVANKRVHPEKIKE